MADIQLKPGWLRRDVLGTAVSVAWDNLRAAKRRMDEAQALLNKFEKEHRGAAALCG